MPWNSNDGDRPERPSPPPTNPWGNPPTPLRPRQRPRPQSGNGPTGLPPEIDRLVAPVMEFFRGEFFRGRRPNLPGGGGGGRGSGGRGIALLGLAVVAAWLASGFYRVQPDQQGVVQRFGAFTRTTTPGLNYHLPWPIETAQTPAVTSINSIQVGFRQNDGQPASPVRRNAGQVQAVVDPSTGEVLSEALMLTGDENIVDINCNVQWHVRDAAAYLFNTRDPDGTARAVVESVIRSVIGRTPIQDPQTAGRAVVEQSIMTGAQSVLDQYGTGIEIVQVQLKKVDPPADVIESYRDQQRATADADRARNVAEGYRNDKVPRARGQAATIVNQAEGARQASIAEATGQAQRFLSVLAAYAQAKDVTLQRLYIETMQQIMAKSPATIVDDRLKGVVPYLPIDPARTSPAVAQGTTP